VDLELKKRTKLFLYHGEHDSMIPVDLAKKSYEVFGEKGLDYTLDTEYGLEHSLSFEELQKIKAFLSSRMI